MTKESIKKSLLVIFEEYGLQHDNEEIFYDDIESIVFVSVVISIEDYFNITIPDRYLEINIIFSLDILSTIIMEQLLINGGVNIWVSIMQILLLLIRDIH